jgi:hypothetical protein
MPSGEPERSFVAKLPSEAITRGPMSSICRARNGLQASISSTAGSRLPGGLHLTTLAMKTSSRRRPISPSSRSSSFPA